MGGNVKLNDGLVSMHTSLGEKSESVRYVDKGKLSDKELMAMYHSSWIVKKFIDKTAEDMLKVPREIKGGVSEEGIKAINDKEDELKTQEVKYEALSWASLMGDVLVVAITDSDEDKIQSELDLVDEEIIRFLVLEKGSYKPSNDIDSDIFSKTFGQPLYYEITVGVGTNQSPIKFHNSRCHRIKLGKHRLRDIRKFGTSDLQAPYNVIKMFDKIMLSISDTIEEANVDVVSMEGLNEQIKGGFEQQVLEYARVAKMSKSASGMLLIDKNDTYDQKTASFGGLSDIVSKAINVLAGALDRPITILFGQSASGFNSGDEDNENYYETIQALQKSRLKPLQDFIDQFILDACFSESEIEELTYEYPSIDSMNEADRADIFTKYATGMAALVAQSIVDEAIAIKELVAVGALISVNEEDINRIISLVANESNWNNSYAGASGEDDQTQQEVETTNAQQTNGGVVSSAA